MQRAEEQVKQAVNLSEIDDTFLSVRQQSHLNSHKTEVNASSRKGQQTHKAAFYSQLGAEFIKELTPQKPFNVEAGNMFRQ